MTEWRQQTHSKWQAQLFLEVIALQHLVQISVWYGVDMPPVISSGQCYSVCVYEVIVLSFFWINHAYGMAAIRTAIPQVQVMHAVESIKGVFVYTRPGESHAISVLINASWHYRNPIRGRKIGQSKSKHVKWGLRARGGQTREQRAFLRHPNNPTSAFSSLWIPRPSLSMHIPLNNIKKRKEKKKRILFWITCSLFISCVRPDLLWVRGTPNKTSK